jgi:hypothetical protein
VPIRNQFSKNIVILILIPAVLLLFSSVSGQDNSDKGPSWDTFETRYTKIHYQVEADLLKFQQEIKLQREHWSIKHLFSPAAPNDLQEQVSAKVDQLFERVQEILDMSKKMPRVAIMVYPDKKQLRQAYGEIYHKQCKVRAWYRYKNNTVYITVADLQVGMLAHELAHAIIDHYLIVKPPAASAEILARYVDSHLQQ